MEPERNVLQVVGWLLLLHCCPAIGVHVGSLAPGEGAGCKAAYLGTWKTEQKGSCTQKMKENKSNLGKKKKAKKKSSYL